MILQLVSLMLRIENEGFISLVKWNFEFCVSMLLKAEATGM